MPGKMQLGCQHFPQQVACDVELTRAALKVKRRPGEMICSCRQTLFRCGTNWLLG